MIEDSSQILIVQLNFQNQVNEQFKSGAANLKTQFETKLQTAKADVSLKGEQLQKKLPDLTKLLDAYTKEGNVLYSEIQADPTLKHICDAM